MPSASARPRRQSLFAPRVRMRERPPRRDEPLPEPGTLILNAILTENAELDLRSLPPEIPALLENGAEGALEVAADWLEENGRIEGAQLLRHGNALFLDGTSAFSWGLFALHVVDDGELRISGVGALLAPGWENEARRWALLIAGELIVLEPSHVDIRQRHVRNGSSMIVTVVGRRVTALW